MGAFSDGDERVNPPCPPISMLTYARESTSARIVVTAGRTVGSNIDIREAGARRNRENEMGVFSEKPGTRKFDEKWNSGCKKVFRGPCCSSLKFGCGGGFNIDIGEDELGEVAGAGAAQV